PPQVAEVSASVVPYRQPLADALAGLEAADGAVRERCVAAAELILQAFEDLAAATDPPGAYRALRSNTLAQEALWPLAALLPLVSRFFLPPERREDASLLARLAAADAGRETVGVIHAANEREQRGGFSLYVPEYYDARSEWPLVLALHGGSGHGRDFLWTWLKAARAAGAIVISATSRERTWALMGPDVDSANLLRMIEDVTAQFRIDMGRVLLTGMSDGGTFTMLSGVAHKLPATHLAPIAASFRPALLDRAPEGRLRGLPVYLTHGVLDWMFPVQMARDADAALRARGARVEYREVADLSHTYPREENPRILEWLRSTPA
ncbi:MAG: phospholipase, partial [Chloroflexi bacterium]|nr:phospholipase [Chloroflexota bacterium]